MAYVDFESIIASENNGKQKPDESHNTKNRNCVGCSFGCKLVWVK